MSQQSFSNPWESQKTVHEYLNNRKTMQTCTKIGHRRKVLCLEWSVDGKYLASGSQDSMTYIYKLDSEKSFKVKS